MYFKQGSKNTQVLILQNFILCPTTIFFTNVSLWVDWIMIDMNFELFKQETFSGILRLLIFAHQLRAISPTPFSFNVGLTVFLVKKIFSYVTYRESVTVNNSLLISFLMFFYKLLNFGGVLFLNKKRNTLNFTSIV